MADIANSLRGWSATAGSNQPTDSTTIGAGLDDNLRTLQAVVRQFLASQGTNIASAATMDLSTMDGYYASVTGNTTVTGLGTEVAGISYWLEFASTPVIVHNASTLVLPGGANITCVAGDIMRFTSEGSGIWRCTGWLPVTHTGTGGIVHAVSPTLTGTPIAPTAAAGTSTTQIATTAFVSTVSGPTVQVFTTTGSNAYSIPANCKAVMVECYGAGGAGGSANSNGGTSSGGGGGGAGGYVRKWIRGSSVGASVTATVGAAPGGLSAFQGFCTATGGSSGSNGGADTFGDGGVGGIGTSGDVNGNGSRGYRSVTAIMSGQGASSPLGGGGDPVASASAGGAATGKASGGAGAFDSGSPSSGQTGGAGADGIVIVTEFY